MTTLEKVITVDEFEALLMTPEYADRRVELIDGIIVEKDDVVTEEHGFVAGNIYAPLWTFVKLTKVGRVYIEADYKVPGDNWRTPDLSFVAGLEKPIVKKGAGVGMPDLAVEVKSPSNGIMELREKAAYYLKNGSKMVWLVYSKQQIVEVYRLNADVLILQAADTLDGGDLLPGFSMLVSAIFED